MAEKDNSSPDPTSPIYFIMVRDTTDNRMEYTGTYTVHERHVHIRDMGNPDGRHRDVIVPFSSLRRLTATEQPAPHPPTDG